MDPTTFEVFCPDLNCGDSQIAGGGLVPIEARKRRRMNYMGHDELGFFRTLVNRHIHPDGDIRPGLYHFFQCPVCKKTRRYWERDGLLIER